MFPFKVPAVADPAFYTQGGYPPVSSRKLLKREDTWSCTSHRVQLRSGTSSNNCPNNPSDLYASPELEFYLSTRYGLNFTGPRVTLSSPLLLFLPLLPNSILSHSLTLVYLNYPVFYQLYSSGYFTSLSIIISINVILQKQSFSSCLPSLMNLIFFFFFLQQKIILHYCLHFH